MKTNGRLVGRGFEGHATLCNVMGLRLGMVLQNNNRHNCLLLYIVQSGPHEPSSYPLRSRSPERDFICKSCSVICTQGTRYEAHLR